MSEGRKAVAIVALLLFGVMAAGCIGDQTSAPPTPGTEPGTGNLQSQSGEPKELTKVEEREQQINESAAAYFETHKAHYHDYWGGRSEMEIMAADVPLTLLPLLEGVQGQQVSLGHAEFSLPDGQIVPTGADLVNITISWASNTITGLRLAFHAADSPVYNDLGPVRNGGIRSIKITETQADLPHYAVSKWAFRVDALGDPQYTEQVGLANGSIRVTVKAHNGGELYIGPPHPDFWVGRTSFKLFTDSGVFDGAATPALSAPKEVKVPRDAIVPIETKMVVVKLTWEAEGAGPVGLGLQFHGADSTVWQPGVGGTTSGNTRTYNIPANERMADSPYAEHTAWGFRVTPQTGEVLDLGQFKGSYSIETTVVKG
ncbi:MAG: hypothetical protein HY556_06420 [Euryarchaeota archaeon]|nr:hypothetical protein [Euryarchaeota archaeon]